MGNLVNPVSMRLGNTIYWNSLWASYQNNSYSFLLSSDFLLYNYLNWFGNSRYFNKFGWVFFLSHYKIIRFLDKIIVIFFLKDYKFYKFMFEFWSLIVRYLRVSKKKKFNNLDLITKSPFYLKKKIEDKSSFKYLSWFCSLFLYYKNNFSFYNNKYLNLNNDFNYQSTFTLLKKYNFFLFLFFIIFLFLTKNKKKFHSIKIQRYFFYIFFSLFFKYYFTIKLNGIFNYSNFFLINNLNKQNISINKYIVVRKKKKNNNFLNNQKHFSKYKYNFVKRHYFFHNVVSNYFFFLRFLKILRYRKKILKYKKMLPYQKLFLIDKKHFVYSKKKNLIKIYFKLKKSLKRRLWFYINLSVKLKKKKIFFKFNSILSSNFYKYYVYKSLNLFYYLQVLINYQPKFIFKNRQYFDLLFFRKKITSYLSLKFKVFNLSIKNKFKILMNTANFFSNFINNIKLLLIVNKMQTFSLHYIYLCLKKSTNIFSFIVLLKNIKIYLFKLFGCITEFTFLGFIVKFLICLNDIFKGLFLKKKKFKLHISLLKLVNVLYNFNKFFNNFFYELIPNRLYFFKKIYILSFFRKKYMRKYFFFRKFTKKKKYFVNFNKNLRLHTNTTLTLKEKLKLKKKKKKLKIKFKKVRINKRLIKLEAKLKKLKRILLKLKKKKKKLKKLCICLKKLKRLKKKNKRLNKRLDIKITKFIKFLKVSITNIKKTYKSFEKNNFKLPNVRFKIFKNRLKKKINNKILKKKKKKRKIKSKIFSIKKKKKKNKKISLFKVNKLKIKKLKLKIIPIKKVIIYSKKKIIKKKEKKKINIKKKKNKKVKRKKKKLKSKKLISRLLKKKKIKKLLLLKKQRLAFFKKFNYDSKELKKKTIKNSKFNLFFSYYWIFHNKLNILKKKKIFFFKDIKFFLNSKLVKIFSKYIFKFYKKNIRYFILKKYNKWFLLRYYINKLPLVFFYKTKSFNYFFLSNYSYLINKYLFFIYMKLNYKHLNKYLFNKFSNKFCMYYKFLLIFFYKNKKKIYNIKNYNFVFFKLYKDCNFFTLKKKIYNKKKGIILIKYYKKKKIKKFWNCKYLFNKKIHVAVFNKKYIINNRFKTKLDLVKFKKSLIYVNNKNYKNISFFKLNFFFFINKWSFSKIKIFVRKKDKKKINLKFKVSKQFKKFLENPKFNISKKLIN